MPGRETFEIVFLCTGNRFRSPIAAAVFASAVSGDHVRVRSLGTAGMSGAPPFAEALRIGSAYGLDLSSHRSRTLADHELGDEADLVVGFETQHVARAVVDGGVSRSAAFLLVELVRILEDCVIPDVQNPVERARVAVTLASEQRPASAVELSIPDPVGASAAVFEQIAERVRAQAARLALLLFGRP